MPRHSNAPALGLFPLVRQNGSKSWDQHLTIQSRRREIGLGVWPIVTLTASREAALANARAADEGRDPIAERRDARLGSSITFSNALARYAEAKLSELSSEKYRLQWVSSVEKHACPKIRKKAVDQIETRNVLKVLQPLW